MTPSFDTVDPCLHSTFWPPNFSGQTPKQVGAIFPGALIFHPSTLQPPRTNSSTGKSDSIPKGHRLAHFNEFYRQCPRRPLQCSPLLSSWALPIECFSLSAGEWTYKNASYQFPYRNSASSQFHSTRMAVHNSTGESAVVSRQ